MPITYQQLKAKNPVRQVHCTSCGSINYGKLIYAGHSEDLVECSDCGYPNTIR